MQKLCVVLIRVGAGLCWMINFTLRMLTELPNSVMIGSMSLGVDVDGSDCDVCVFSGEFVKLCKDTFSDIPENRGDYSYSSGALLGNVAFHKKVVLSDAQSPVDIIVFDDLHQMSRIHKVQNDLLRLPTYMVRNKGLRVSIFEAALGHYQLGRVE